MGYNASFCSGTMVVISDVTSTPVSQSIVLAPELSNLARAREFVKSVACDAGFAQERVFDIAVVCSEAAANAIEHAAVKERVEVKTLLYADRLEIQVAGPGRFQTPNRLQERASRGLGLPLMATLSDHLALYSGPHGGTLVSLSFYLPGAEREDAGTLPPSLEELGKETSLLKNVVENIPDGFYVLDDEWRYVYVTDRLLDSLKMKRDDLIGRVFWDVFADLEPEGRRVLESAKAGHKGARIVRINRAANLWREGFAFPIAGGMAVISRDISDVMRAQDALRRSEERDAFLLGLDDLLRPLDDPGEIRDAAVRRLSEHLGAGGTLYAEIEGRPGDEWSVTRAACSVAGSTVPERFPCTVYGEPVITMMRRGENAACGDVAASDWFDPTRRAAYLAAGVRSFVAVPLATNGRWAAVFGVHCSAPRAWTASEIDLVREVGERTLEAAGRQLRLAELKREVNRLLAAAGRPPRYEV